MFGWAGKILHIDLGSQNVTRLDTEAYAQQFIGGLGIGEKLYWDMAPPGVDPFHSDNPLILMTGPLAATPAPSAPRLVACGKSPCIYPETFVNANMGGFIAAELKKAGYDGLVLTGKAEKPVYITIEDGRVEIKDAAHVWGQGNTKTREMLHDELGTKWRLLTIGPAGENMSRIGILFTDAGSSASMGFGSVMGSKNLKAIAVRGTGSITVADPEKIKEIRRRFKSMTGEGYFHLFNNPIKLPGSEVVKRVHCHGCPQGCWRSLHRSAGGSEDIRKCQIGNFYTLWEKKYKGELTETSFDAPAMANDIGVCTMEVVFLFLWLEQCRDKGILTRENTGLDLESMGSREFLETAMHQISTREGFGDIMAEGVLRASEKMGEASREITRNILTGSGRAIAYGPKVFSMSAVIYAVEPRPFITELHEICEPLTKWAIWHNSKGEKTYMSTDVLRRISALFWGGEEAVDFSTYVGKAVAARNVQNRQFIKEALNLCDFAWPVYDNAGSDDHVGDPAMERRLFTAVTGWDISQQELDTVAERLVTLNRAIVLREGRRGRQDDVLPEFMFIERPEMIADVFGMYNPELFLPGKGSEVISRKGKAVDRREFEKMMDEYYQLRGWDVETGVPTQETLVRLGLSDC